MKSFYVKTFGCQMNENDSERIVALLRRQGMTPATSEEVADVVVFNTCTIRENADNRFFGQVNKLRERRAADSHLRIVVAGCLAQGEQEAIFDRAPHVDVVVGTHALASIVELLERSDQERRVIDVREIAQGPDPLADLGAEPTEGHKAWVTIQTGCDNNCAFCIVPQVRGGEVSRPFQAVVDEVRSLASQGVTEVTLLGQNVNSYGRDLTRRLRTEQEGSHDRGYLTGQVYVSGSIARIRPLFADLLRAVGAVDGIRRVRFTSPHPKDMREETFRAMADSPAVCESLHFPLQSGSDRVLAAMHRGYRGARFFEKLTQAREIVPDLAVTTDIIVGFPGETDEDFEATLELVARCEFDSAFTFIYSPRPGTEAGAWTDRFVDPEVIAQRFAQLKLVTERSASAKHRDRVGRVEEILIDGPSKRDALVASGRTRQNKLVHLTGFDGERNRGRYVQARIVDAGAHFLHGEILEAPR
ncbi:MiaB/RimO family radical SAM methylthiotransferase [Ferrimicrobium sp.]|uniref:MiaB/RimO family radical SAM methylthiotransferase n=1 Tax=Ferrimicrobium sp. TaxID=2926050 RepID=UPI002631A833|nr:MiaB/RimO family radical SAM methylthiotransferase [Ferrimicrobium sp.]